MKILVTGGYGFIGSFVSEKFIKEGHDVIIIDNMSSGNVKNCDFRHVSYIVDAESPFCEPIFQNHQIDVVVHLAAQINIVTSMENPYADTKSNILGLTNMLQLSAKYNVKKFIFASSAAVYGLNETIPLNESGICQPISPYGINKLLGEYYCTKWNEIYNLNTLCLRFANVYGPRQGAVGEGGVISTFMERIRDGKELHINGNGEQTRDFIYVEDVADAIYLASESPYSGIMNLSTNTENSVNHVVDILSKLTPISAISNKPARSGDIGHSCLDNTRVTKKLGWKPKFSLQDGLTRTFKWFSQTKKNPQKGTNQPDQISPQFNEVHINKELIATSFSRNIRSLYLSHSDRYLEGKPVLKADVFAAVISSRQQAKLKFGIDYALLALPKDIINHGELLYKTMQCLRETDYIGMTEHNNVSILLSNSTAKDAGIVVDRLRKQFIETHVWMEPDPQYK